MCEREGRVEDEGKGGGGVAEGGTCLILMLTRTELMLGSMRQRSVSVRAMMSLLSRSSLLLPTSTSGLLWRSTTCEGKLRRHVAAVSVLCTASRYGLSAGAGAPPEDPPPADCVGERGGGVSKPSREGAPGRALSLTIGYAALPKVRFRGGTR